MLAGFFRRLILIFNGSVLFIFDERISANCDYGCFAIHGRFLSAFQGLVFGRRLRQQTYGC
jgi:hypothetical protein